MMKTFHPFKILLAFCLSIITIYGDAIDDTMLSDMSTLNVLGAGATFFDAVSTAVPVKNGNAFILRSLCVCRRLADPYHHCFFSPKLANPL
jgi:hypothetical protein